ncbi:MAG: pentapeptide repeat-containing protein, partial [Terracidiphilus sp.]
PRLDVRLGGIYALDRIAGDSPRDGLTIDQVLSAYLRRNAAVTSTNANIDSSSSTQVRVDFQAIVTILGNRSARKLPGRVEPLNLYDVDLSGVSFADGHFDGFVFNDALLRGCDFRRAKLNSAKLVGAHFEGASDLTDADLTGADVRGGILDGATLAGASFRGSQLQRASFKGAKVGDADFTGAVLEDAHFEGVIFTNAKGLCLEQLDHIVQDHGTRPPTNLAACPK